MTGRNLVILDVDGTLTKELSIWQYLLEQTNRWQGAGEYNLAKFLDGQIDYAEFCRLDAQLLQGLEYTALQEIAHGVAKYEGIDELFAHLTQNNYVVGFLSTGLRLITSYFSEKYNVDFCLVNDLGQENGRISGEAVINVGYHEKGQHARALIETYNADHVIAIGDSGGDIPVFELADTTIAINATNPQILALATHRYHGNNLADIRAYI